MKSSARSIDEYISACEEPIRVILEKVRATIKAAAPEAEECINYAIPTFKLEGNLVHFAAYKSHVGFYPAPSGIEAFKKDISKYKWAKGSVQFPYDQAIPYALITKIVKFRVKENLMLAAEKKKKK